MPESKGNASPDAQLPESAGRLLALARERMDMSLADVARALRLGAKQIEAIEADDYARLPGRTFVRGFIRNYARLVQLDPDQVLAVAAFDSEAETASRRIEAPSQQIKFSDRNGKPWLKWLLAGAVTVAMASWAVLEWLGPEQTAKVHVGVTAPAPVVSEEPSAPLAAAAVQAPATAPVVADKAVQPEPAALPSSAPSSAPATALARLTMSFSGQAWVEVRDKNGKKLHSQIDPAGSERTLEGEPPLSLVIGSAPKVALTYKGEPVDLAPYTKADVARLKLE